MNNKYSLNGSDLVVEFGIELPFNPKIIAVFFGDCLFQARGNKWTGVQCKPEQWELFLQKRVEISIEAKASDYNLDCAILDLNQYILFASQHEIKTATN